MSPVVTVTMETTRCLQLGQSLRALMDDERIFAIVPEHVRAIFTEHGETLRSAAMVEVMQTDFVDGCKCRRCAASVQAPSVDEQMEAGHA